MRFARVAAAATAVSLVGAATLVSPAQAATSGVGTSAASSSLLNVSVGTNGSVLNLKVLADEARATIDPSVATPEGFSRLNALSVSSSLLPAPLNNISVPVMESRTPGGAPTVAGPSINLSSPVPGVTVPAAVLTGVLTPASLTSGVDASGARAGLTSSIANVSLVGGLVSAASFESSLGTVAKPEVADSGRTVKVGAITVLDLGALLNGLGVPLSALPLDTVSSILATLGVPVAGVPSSLTVESFVDELNATIDALETQATGATGGVVDDALDAVATDVLDGLSLPVPDVGDPITTVTGVVNQVQGMIGDVLETAITALDGAALLKANGIEVGTVTKATDTVAGSTADIVAKIGSIQIGGLTVPGLDVGATLAQVNGVLGTVNGTLSSVLGAVSPDLANMVQVSLFEKDSTTGVTSSGGYTKALAGVTALSASINPPLNLEAIVTGLVGGAGIGSVLTGVGGSLPAVDTVMPALNGLLGPAVSALSGGATIKLASVNSGASFTTPVAASNGTLPRTGGTAQTALIGMALVIAAIASRRFVMARRAL